MNSFVHFSLSISSFSFLLGVFMFAEKETTLRFVSDQQNSRTGFDIRVRQIKICSPEAKGEVNHTTALVNVQKHT